MPHWKCWPQILQSREPTPAFLSTLTETAFSWLQKRQVKTEGRGSFYKGGGGGLLGIMRKVGLERDGCVPCEGRLAFWWPFCACPLFLVVIRGSKREVGCAIELMVSLGLCEDAPGVLWVCYLERV